MPKKIKEIEVAIQKILSQCSCEDSKSILNTTASSLKKWTTSNSPNSD